MSIRPLQSRFRQCACVIVCVVGSMLDAAHAQDNFGPAPESLSGSYSGVYFCQSQLFRFEFDLTSDASGRLSGEMSVVPEARRRGTREVRESTTISGTYNPVTGGVAIAGATPVFRQQVELQGVVLRNGRDWVVVPVARRFQPCSPWLVNRGGRLGSAASAALDAAEFTAGPPGIGDAIAAQRAARSARCDEDLLRWLRQIPQRLATSDERVAVRPLFRDEYFKEAFGRTLSSMSGGKRRATYMAMVGGCQRDAGVSDQERRYLTTAAAAFMNLPPLHSADVTVHAGAAGLAAAWRRESLDFLDAGIRNSSATPDSVDAFSADAEPLSGIDWPDESEAFQNALAARIGNIIEPALLADLEARVSAVASAEDALRLREFLGEHRADYARLDAATQKRVMDSVTARAGDVVERLAGPALAELAARPPGLDRLRQSAAWYRENEDVLIAFTTSPAVEQLMATHADLREQSARTVDASFRETIASADDPAQLAGIAAATFIRTDLSTAGVLRDAASARVAALEREKEAARIRREVAARNAAQAERHELFASDAYSIAERAVECVAAGIATSSSDVQAADDWTSTWTRAILAINRAPLFSSRYLSLHDAHGLADGGSRSEEDWASEWQGCRSDQRFLHQLYDETQYDFPNNHDLIYDRATLLKLSDEPARARRDAGWCSTILELYVPFQDAPYQVLGRVNEEKAGLEKNHADWLAHLERVAPEPGDRAQLVETEEIRMATIVKVLSDNNDGKRTDVFLISEASYCNAMLD